MYVYFYESPCVLWGTVLLIKFVLFSGETEKVFRLRLVSDGVYEATEYFTLQLHAPISAATEAPLTTTVRVNDSRDGTCFLRIRT